MILINEITESQFRLYDFKFVIGDYATYNSYFKIVLETSEIIGLQTVTGGIKPSAEIFNNKLILIAGNNFYIYDLDGETAGKLFALATCIARAMRDALKCDGLNLVQNNGEIAGQTVNHFHLHLIPRYEGDGLNLNWPQQEISAEQLEEIRQSIKKSI